MFPFILIPLLAIVLIAASVRMQGARVDQRVTGLVLGSYALRLLISPVTHTIPVFSTATGIDSSAYEGQGALIARVWSYTGVRYISGDDLPSLKHVSLPPNVFAVVSYLNGGPSHLGCVAIVAAMAAFVCLDIYLIARVMGARTDVALAVAGLISVLPSFLFYTSDTYKDGFVVFFAMGVLTSSIRLSYSFSAARLVWVLVLFAGLWETRFYLVFVLPAPLLLGVLGLRSGSVMRVLLAALVIGASVAAVYAYSNVATTATNRAVDTFQQATSQNVLEANEDTASGVTLGTGLSSLPVRLAYTLFSPFPWQSGSLGLQIEKLEVFVWYYFAYRAYRAAKAQWRTARSNLLVIVSFVVPISLAYAFTFSNIGLIVRERMEIVLATIILATTSWPAVGETAKTPDVRPSATPAVRRAAFGVRSRSVAWHGNRTGRW